MDSASLMSIRVIPKSVKEETGHHALERLHHTPYRDEVRLFSCLQRGDLKKLIYELGQIGIQNITVGQMSENDLQQQKYMAVSFITLATRYAIQGGLGESNAYAYSDDFIRRIDAASAKRAVHAAIVDGAIELTNMVSRAQKDLTYSPHVRRCIAYINKNPDRKLTVAAVAPPPRPPPRPPPPPAGGGGGGLAHLSVRSIKAPPSGELLSAAKLRGFIR